MPSLINALGFPVPESFDNDVAKRPPISEALNDYLRAREEAIKKHNRQLSKGVNAVGQAAFSPKTYITALTADVTATGTTTGTSVALTDLAQTIVSPIPATIWFDLTLRAEESGGVASQITVEVKVDGAILRPVALQNLAATTTETISLHGFYDKNSADTALWVHPQTSYAITVHIWKSAAGATVKALKGGGTGDTCLRVRVEPRLLAP